MTIDTASARKAVLLIDDNDVAARNLRNRLIDRGYSVRLTASAEMAIATVETTGVDLILLSIILPDTDGLILCSTLRGRTAAPIIVLSARPGDVDRLLALELGANEFLTEPVDVDDLMARIEALLTRGHAIIGRLRLMP